jgi:nitrate reductase alpha subunit
VGIKPAPDVEQGAGKYIELRTEWAQKINVLAQSMLYPTERVDPDRAKGGSSGRVPSFRTRSYASPHQIFYSKEK